MGSEEIHATPSIPEEITATSANENAKEMEAQAATKQKIYLSPRL